MLWEAIVDGRHAQHGHRCMVMFVPAEDLPEACARVAAEIGTLGPGFDWRVANIRSASRATRRAYKWNAKTKPGGIF